MKILVSGGAGYVGSHFAHALAQRGVEHIVLDDVRRGDVRLADATRLVRGDVGDTQAVADLCRLHGITHAVHFAAYAYVGESVTAPSLYYANNVAAMARFLDGLVGAGVCGVIFSSSCATYGPYDQPIDESFDQRPINPYGRTKLVGEGILRDYEAAYGLRFTALRYFNAAGAAEDAVLFEEHDPETHLIPLTVRAAMGGAPLRVFGTDYPTPDGTCVRDYVHVSDLADAHVAALERLYKGAPSRDYNLGTGRGHSVREVIESVERIVGRPVAREEHPRRHGDPPRLVADPRRAYEELGWEPRYVELDDIVRTAVLGELRRNEMVHA